MSNTPTVYRASGPMGTRPAYQTPAHKRVEHTSLPRGQARETSPLNETMPYEVRFYGKRRSYANARDALAWARTHNGAEVYFTAPRTEVIDMHSFVKDDKAKPAKGSCGTFSRGQTTAFLPVIATRENLTTRIY